MGFSVTSCCHTIRLSDFLSLSSCFGPDPNLLCFNMVGKFYRDNPHWQHPCWAEMWLLLFSLPSLFLLSCFGGIYPCSALSHFLSHFKPPFFLFLSPCLSVKPWNKDAVAVKASFPACPIPPVPPCLSFCLCHKIIYLPHIPFLASSQCSISSPSCLFRLPSLLLLFPHTLL